MRCFWFLRGCWFWGKERVVECDRVSFYGFGSVLYVYGLGFDSLFIFFLVGIGFFLFFVGCFLCGVIVFGFCYGVDFKV